MIELIDLLKNDPVVKNSVNRTKNLRHHVSRLLEARHDELFGPGATNTTSALSSYFLPALQAYYTLASRNGDLLPIVQSETKRGLRALRQSPSTNFSHCFKQLCKEIDKVIPELESELVCRSVAPGQSKDTLKNYVQRRALQVAKRDSQNLSNFWVLASLYYKHEKTAGITFIPNPNNLFQVVPLSVESLKLLETHCKDMLEDFCIKHQAVNSATQEAVTQGGGRYGLRDSAYLTQVNGELYPIPFASKMNFQSEVKNELARDLLAFSFKLESWEALVYFDSSTRLLEYVPCEIAACYFIVQSYKTLLKLVNAGEDDPKELAFHADGSFNFYIANIHNFMRSIYDSSGTVTENAEYLLAGFRRFKHNSPKSLVSPRGSNIFQDATSADSRRRGKKFY
ncbi:hypothetical protein AAEX28_07760 [Lentisphaerota bacterium WC36G]|nr:hypothetical protein LJT99_10620 [Lentisphaerae bacterium WC36]